MSRELAAETAAGADGSAPKSRKAITKKLSTGHRITLSPQDDRTLKTIYEFCSGYAKRKQIESAIELRKREVDQLLKEIPASAKILMKQRAAAGIGGSAGLYGKIRTGGPLDDDDTVIGGTIDDETTAAGDSRTLDSRTEGEIAVDAYYRAKEHLTKIEDKLKAHMMTDHKISFKDLDAVIRSLGTNMPRKQVEQMIWEVDENLDDLIDYDEFQLTYYRNITDVTGNEPCSFFKILEFMIFDGSHKGYIIEDDCMEILYGRYGGLHLEQEMKLLFGNRLRAEGGDGTLVLDTYLASVLGRTGRRALVV